MCTSGILTLSFNYICSLLQSSILLVFGRISNDGILVLVLRHRPRLRHVRFQFGFWTAIPRLLLLRQVRRTLLLRALQPSVCSLVRHIQAYPVGDAVARQVRLELVSGEHLNVGMV